MPKKLVKQKQRQKQSVIVNVNVAKSQGKSRGKTRAKKSGGGGSVMMLPPPIYSHPISNLIPQAFSKEGKQMSQPTLEDQVNAVLKKRYEDERERDKLFRERVVNTPILSEVKENKPQSILSEVKENKPITLTEEIQKVIPKKQSNNLLQGPAKNLGLIAQLMKRQEKIKPKTEEDVLKMEEEIKQKIPGPFQKQEKTQLKVEEPVIKSLQPEPKFTPGFQETIYESIKKQQPEPLLQLKKPLKEVTNPNIDIQTFQDIDEEWQYFSQKKSDDIPKIFEPPNIPNINFDEPIKFSFF